MKKNPLVAVIVVGYNSLKYLEDCLSSLKESSYKEFQVFFIDNNSTDGSVDYVRKTFPETKIIKSKQNLGFAAGNNLGIKLARRAGAKYVFLLNPDTITDRNCLACLVNESEQHLAIYQPLVLLHNGRKTNLINTAGNLLHYVGFSYVGGYEKTRDSFRDKREIAVASGAAFFAPTDAIEEIGGFDDNFFMYLEDTDLSWRLRLAGYSFQLVPQAVVWHKYSFSKNSRKFYFIERNRLLFLAKNYQLHTLILLLPILLVTELMMLCYSALGGWFVQKIRADFSAVIELPRTLKKRAVIQKKRSLSDRAVKRYFISELRFEEVTIPAMKLVNALYRYYWTVINPLI